MRELAVHGGPCPPAVEVTVITIGSKWRDEYRSRETGKWERHPETAGMDFEVLSVDGAKGVVELKDNGRFGSAYFYNLGAFVPEGILVPKDTDPVAFELYDRWRWVPAN